MIETLKALERGEVALLSTDTVYGLAAIPGSKGYNRIFQLKRRLESQVLPWIISGVEDLQLYGIDVPEYAVRLARMFWPGALTLVVPASDLAMGYGCLGPRATVALRCPDDESCLEILGKLRSPLACTSANIHGDTAPARIQDVDSAFLELPHREDILAACKQGRSSTIVDCTGEIPQILRAGDINQQLVLAVAFLDAKLD